MSVGWIGLGSMGSAMARNMQAFLAKTKQKPLCFFNRTASRGMFLREEGAVQHGSAANVIKESDITFLSLSDDAALQALLQEILSVGDLSGKIIVDTTTVHPDTTRKAADAITRFNGHFVAAPVFGATPVAEAGKLLVAVSGPEQATQKIIPLLRGALAREVIIVDEAPEKAVLLKTIGNFMTAGIMEMVAEAHVFAEKSGLDASVLESLIEQNYGQVALFNSQRMLHGAYIPKEGQAPWSSLELGLKDVGHGVSSAQAVGVKLRMGELVLQNLQKAKKYSDENGQRPLDSSSMFGVVRQEAGLDFCTDQGQERDRQ